MPRKMITKKVKQQYKRIMQQLVEDLSQNLVIVQESPMFVDCPNCIWDSINKKSANVFDSTFTSSVTIFQNTDQERVITPISFTSGRCPVCVGEGQLFTNKEVCVPAMINFMSPSSSRGAEFLSSAAGKEAQNFLVVKTHACHHDLLVDNEVFFVHGNIKCTKFRPPILRGLGGDEAVAEIMLQTADEAQSKSGKFGGGTKLSRDDDPRKRIKGPSDIIDQRGNFKGR